MTLLSCWNQKPFGTNLFESEFNHLLAERTFTPPCDIEEKDTHFLLTLDLPGLHKEDIEVEVNEDTLTVSGFRKEEKKSEESSWLKSERFTGKFLRAFSLGESVDVKSIQASYEDGVLKLQIPRLKETKSEVIKIKVEEKLKDSH
jgi:HSP20 family protein